MPPGLSVPLLELVLIYETVRNDSATPTYVPSPKRQGGQSRPTPMTKWRREVDLEKGLPTVQMQPE